MSNNSISLAISNAWASFQNTRNLPLIARLPFPWGESGYETSSNFRMKRQILIFRFLQYSYSSEWWCRAHQYNFAVFHHKKITRYIRFILLTLSHAGSLVVHVHHVADSSPMQHMYKKVFGEAPIYVATVCFSQPIIISSEKTCALLPIAIIRV